MTVNLKSMQVHLAGIASLGVCLLSTYGFGIRPVLQAQEQLQQIIMDAEHLQRLLPSLERDTDSLKVQLASQVKKLQERYPIVTQPGQPLLGIVSKLLAERHIDLVNLREDTHTTAGQRTLVLQANSGYEDMLTFVSDLRKLDCPARISHFKITPLDEQGLRCSATLTVHFSPIVPLPHVVPSIGYKA